MTPILYAPDETAFETNGIGALSGAVSCFVDQELNGINELEMRYPVSGNRFADIVNRAIILAKPDPYTRPQPYRIYRITKPMNGIVTVYAQHISYDLKGVPVSPFHAIDVSEAMQRISEHTAVSCPFNFQTDKDTISPIDVQRPISVWKLLGGSSGSILDVYGGEYDFDRFDVTLRKRLGEDRGVSIRYGKNLTSLEQDENCANCYTGVYPYWAGSDGTVVQLDEKVIYADGNFDYVRILDLDLSSEFESAPSQDQLRYKAETYMRNNKIGVPDISWTISFIQLAKTSEYKDRAILEEIYLGDTVSVLFDRMGVNASARAVKTRYNVILDRYESISLGRVKPNLSDTIARQQQAMDNIPTGNDLSAAVDRSTNWIVNGKGYMVAIRDEAGNWKEIVSLDTPNLNEAKNVWRWNNAGFGHSSNGYNGPYDTAITQDGHIVADFIAAGVLQSKDEGKTFRLDLDNGTFSSAKFYAQDGNAYIALEDGVFVLYAKAGENGAFTEIARIGYTEDSEGYDYPYMLMGSTGAASEEFDKLGLYKMFRNGVWLGNSAPRYSTGSFVGLVGAAGIFIDTMNAAAYVVNGTDMEELYHGTVDATFA